MNAVPPGQKLLVTPHILSQEHNYRKFTQTHAYLAKEYIPSLPGSQVGP